MTGFIYILVHAEEKINFLFKKMQFWIVDCRKPFMFCVTDGRNFSLAYTKSFIPEAHSQDCWPTKMELFAEIIIGFLQTSIFVFQLFLNAAPHTSIDLLNTFSRLSYCIWVNLKKRKTKTQNSVIISWSSFLKLLILTRVFMNVDNINTVKLIVLTP